LADAQALGFGADPRNPLLDAEPAEGPGVYQHAVGGLERLIERIARRLASDANYLSDRQLVLACELEVAAVMSRYAHDRARAVGGEHVVGDPDRDPLLGEGVDGVLAGEDTGLLVLRGEALYLV